MRTGKYLFLVFPAKERIGTVIMRKNMTVKKILSLFIATGIIFNLCIGSSFAVSQSSTSTYSYSTSNPRGMLLYVGYIGYYNSKYATYSATDILKLAGATTEFVLCSGNCMYNSYEFDHSQTDIITEAKINSLSSSLINNASDLNNIKADYRLLLNGNVNTSSVSRVATGESHIAELFGHLDPMRYENKYLNPGDASINATTYYPVMSYWTLDALADDVVSLINTIVSVQPNATIWIPFPLVAFSSLAAEYRTPFTEYVSYLKSQLGSKWNTNVRGFYWGTEAVVQYYTPFNYSSSASNGYGNPLVQLMIYMDSVVSGTYGKQFLWIPYMSVESETQKRNGYVINQTTIFDYALMQPGYYFKGTTSSYNNFALIKQSVLNNKLYNSSGVIGGGKVSGGATLGYEMEIDSHITETAFNDRYWEYTNQFSTISSYPTMFYAGDRNDTCSGTTQAESCFYYVKTWLNN